MKRKLQRLAVIFATGWTSLALADPVPLANGDFESGLSDWNSNGNVSVITVNSNALALLEEPGAGARSSLSQTFNLPEDPQWLSFRYHLSAAPPYRDSDAAPDSFAAYLYDENDQPLYELSGPADEAFKKAFFYADSDRVEFSSPAASVTGPDADNLYTVTLDISNLTGQPQVRLEFGLAGADNKVLSFVVLESVSTDCPEGHCCYVPTCVPPAACVPSLAEPIDDGNPCTQNICSSNGVDHIGEAMACPQVEIFLVVDKDAYETGLGEPATICSVLDAFTSGFPEGVTVAIREFMVPTYLDGDDPRANTLEDTCPQATGHAVHSDLNGSGTGTNSIPSISDENYPCPGGIKGPETYFTTASLRNWGPALAIVNAEYTGWTTASIRVVVPIVKESPCWGGSNCNAGDDAILATAIAEAKSRGIIVVPLLVNAPTCLKIMLTNSGVQWVDLGESNAGQKLADIVAKAIVTKCLCVSEDCNNNQLPDTWELDLGGETVDLDLNGVLDECEDCNNNGLPDYWEVTLGGGNDFDLNGVPDECDDCNNNSVFDPLELDHAVQVDQWVSSVGFYSSQYSGTDWSAQKLLGPSDLGETQLLVTSENTWRASTKDNASEYVAVYFSQPVYATGVTVYEAFNHGFVTDVDVITIHEDSYAVWSGTDPAGPPPPIQPSGGTLKEAYLSWPQTEDLIKGVIVQVNGQHVVETEEFYSWEEIDAIQLHGVTNDCNANGTLDLCDIANDAQDLDENQILDACEYPGSVEVNLQLAGLSNPVIRQVAFAFSDCDGEIIQTVVKDVGFNSNGLAAVVLGSINPLAGSISAKDCLSLRRALPLSWVDVGGIQTASVSFTADASSGDESLRQGDLNGDNMIFSTDYNAYQSQQNTYGDEDDVDPPGNCDQRDAQGFRLADFNGDGLVDSNDVFDFPPYTAVVGGPPSGCQPGGLTVLYSEADCNSNGIEDWQDIAEGTSIDCDSNGVPDECPGFEDVNTNGVPDACEVPVLLSANSVKLHCTPQGMLCTGTIVAVPASDLDPRDLDAYALKLVWQVATFDTNGASFGADDFTVSSGSVNSVTHFLNKNTTVNVSGVEDEQLLTLEFTAQTAASIPKSFSLCWSILKGDANQDGVVDADGDDLDFCASHNGESASAGPAMCDFDADNIIEWASGTLDDYNIADAHDGNTVGFCEVGN